MEGMEERTKQTVFPQRTTRHKQWEVVVSLYDLWLESLG